MQDRRGHVHLEGSQAQPFEHLFILTELGGAKDAYFDALGEARFEELFEFPRPSVEGGFGKADMSHADDELAAFRSAAGECEHK